MHDESGRFDLFPNCVFQLGVIGFLEGRSWEKIADERHEQRLVFVDQFRQVHVSQHSHDNHALRVADVLSFGCAQRPQYGQNVSQTEIVVDLLRQLFFAELVQSVEFMFSKNPQEANLTRMII